MDRVPAIHPPPPLALIERQEQITELCAAATAAGRFAFDTEFVMEDRFEPEVCLIQIAAGDCLALIDPFLSLDLAPIWNLVCDDRLLTIVHAGQEDLSLCVQHTGRPPRHVFDVQIAAGLVSTDYPLSLQRLVQSMLHIRLHKAKTLTDWRRRPLTASQLRYAAEDVCHLTAIHRLLVDRLETLGRSAWATEEFAAFEQVSLYRRAEEDKLLRVKGAGALKGRQLAIVRDLLVWREAVGRQRNRPARTVLRDHLLVEIAKLGLANFAEIRDLRGVNLSDRDVHAMCRHIHAAMETPSSDWPVSAPADIETPGESVLTALSTAILKSYCAKQDIAYGLVASKKSVRQHVRHHVLRKPPDKGEVELLSGWRGQAVGGLLDEVLTGRSMVQVVPAGGNEILRMLPATDGRQKR